MGTNFMKQGEKEEQTGYKKLSYRCQRGFYRFPISKFSNRFYNIPRDHGGRVVTLSPPTSEAGVRFTALPQVGKLVVAFRW